VFCRLSMRFLICWIFTYIFHKRDI
jgi:hypothetical protein